MLSHTRKAILFRNKETSGELQQEWAGSKWYKNYNRPTWFYAPLTCVQSYTKKAVVWNAFLTHKEGSGIALTEPTYLRELIG